MKPLAQEKGQESVGAAMDRTESCRWKRIKEYTFQKAVLGLIQGFFNK